MGYDQHCPRYERAVDFLGKRWTGLILRTLMGGAPMRFGEIRCHVPALSDRLLSERLNELEREGVVVRHVHTAKPVVVEYELTAMGRALRPIVDAIQSWSDVWYEGEAAPTDAPKPNA